MPSFVVMKKEKDVSKRILIGFDWFIKKLLRHKSNYVILEGFLSELLKKDITIQEILESETNKEESDDKSSKVDILCKYTDDELIIIELQFFGDIDYFQRILFTAYKTITNYLAEGAKYELVKKIYSINILYFDLGQGEDYLYHGVTNFVGMNQNDNLKLNSAQQLKVGKELPSDLYPEYYIIKTNNFKNIIKKEIDQWIYFFKNSKLPENYTAKGLTQVEEKLKYEDMSPELKQQYNKHKDNLLVSLSQLEMAGIEGEIKGEIKGEIRGKIKGKIEGEIKGKIEGEIKGVLKAHRQTVINGFKNGLEIKMLSNITQLTEEEVIKILKEEGLMK